MAQISRLTKLFVKISEKLTEDDVRDLRALVAIEKVLGKARVQNASTLEILDMLVDNATIGERNLGFLVEVLTSLKKKALAKKAERLEQGYKMEESELQDSDASGSENSDHDPEHCTDKFKTPEFEGSKAELSGPDETEVESVIKPKIASDTPEMLILPSESGETKTERQAYKRRPQAAAAVQDSVGTSELQQGAWKKRHQSENKIKPRNMGNANGSRGKRVGYVFIICLILVVVYKVMEWNEKDFGLYYFKKGQYKTALEWFLKNLEIQHESEDTANQIIAHMYVANTYRLLAKTDQATAHFDTAFQMAEQTGDLHGQMDVYCKMGDMQREQLHSPRAAIQYYEQYLALARQLEDRGEEEVAYSRLGQAHYEMEEYETALEWYQKNMEIRQKPGDKANLLTALKNIAGSYKALRKLDQARSHYQSAMDIAMETGDKQEQMDIYLKLGDLHGEQLNEPQVAHKYYTEMLALARDLERKGDERLAYNRLGLACGAMQDHEAALGWNQQDLKMSQEDGDKITAHQNIGDSYKALGKLDLAKSHYESAMDIAMETGNKQEQMKIYLRLGDLHRLQLHEPQVSRKYYTEMLQLARDLERKDKKRLAYNRLGLACGDMQDHEAALEWHQKCLKMSQEDGDKTEQITAHQMVAHSYKVLGKQDLARSHYESAMTLAMETGNKQEQMDINLELGELHRKQLHEPQVSYKYYTEMLTLARDLGRKDREGLAYNRLGVACEDMEDHEAALGWYEKCLKISQEDGDKEEQMIAHKCIARSFAALGKLDLVKSHYESAIEIAMERGNKEEQMDINLKLGDLHRKQLHEPQASHEYYTEMLDLARDLERKSKERQAYNRLGLACGDMQDHEAALGWHQKHLKISQGDGDSKEQITAHENIARSYQALGKLDLARSHNQYIAKETGDKQQQKGIAKKLAVL